MKISEPSKSPSRKRDLQKLFYRHRVLQGFREGKGNMFNVSEPHKIAALVDCLLGDGPATLPPWRYVVFVADARYFGHERYLTFLCEGYAMFQPILWPEDMDKADLPYTLEEQQCSAFR